MKKTYIEPTITLEELISAINFADIGASAAGDNVATDAWDNWKF